MGKGKLVKAAVPQPPPKATKAKTKITWKCSILVTLAVIVSVLIIVTCVYFLPPLLIPFTSTTLESLQRVLELNKEMLDLEGKFIVLVDLQKSYTKFAEEQAEELSLAFKVANDYIDQFVKDYAPLENRDSLKQFDANSARISREFFRHRDFLKAMILVDSLSFELFRVTNDYRFWCYDQDLNFLREKGIELCVETSVPEIDDVTKWVQERIDLVFVEKLKLNLEAQETLDYKLKSAQRQLDGKVLFDALKYYNETIIPIITKGSDLMNQYHSLLDRGAPDLKWSCVLTEQKRDFLNYRYRRVLETETNFVNNLKSAMESHQLEFKKYGKLVERMRVNMALRGSPNLDDEADEKDEL